MRWVLTNGQMKTADRYTIESKGVPALTLMERAGEALQKQAEMLAPTGEIVCVCGGGNNGGDGLVCARLLRAKGRRVCVVFFAQRTSEECAINLQKYLKDGGQVFDEIPKSPFALVVDCLLGTGFTGVLSEPYAKAVNGINALKKQGAKVLSADIPSGVNGENGRVESVAVRADITRCIGERKAGVLLHEGIDYAGQTVRADIGIQLPEKEYAYLLDDERISGALPVRKRCSHKGSYGKTAIVAGSEKYTGAAYLSMVASLRSGTGYTVLFTPKEILPYYILKAPEALLEPLGKDAWGKLLAYDAVAYGMGMGVDEIVANGVRFLLERYTGKLILDADALNALSVFFDEEERQSLFARKKCEVVLTPHMKEFSRLTGDSVQTIVDNGLTAPCALAKSWGVTVLLKGAASLICDGERTAVNTTGTSGQAKGGSGDVLSGLIAGLCAQGCTPFDGACVGAYLAGRSAEIACETTGEYSLTATDILANLGSAFSSVVQKSE